jgi:outer membrane protein assembly factor BamB
MRGVFPVAAAIILLVTTPALATDWPMWRCDSRHSAATAQELADNLSPQWTLQLPRLTPAWPDEPRMRFDVAYEPVVVGDTLLLSSPREDAVLAFDTRTARLKWRFMADGPVRFAPAVWNGRVYVGSDDGYLYCLSAARGTLLWKYRAAPEGRLVLGNERLISTWPVRGAPVVDAGRVCFAAGIWPFMGVFVCCLDATTGAVLWRNDDTNATYVNQPHNSPAFAGVAPQGYCTVSGKVLLVPGGRSTPAGFSRDTGELLFFRLAENGKTGDYKVAANANYFFNAGSIYQLTTGALLGGISARPNANPYAPFVTDSTLRLNPDGNASVVTDDLLCGLDQGNVVTRSMTQAAAEEWQDSKGVKYSNLMAPVSAATNLAADRVWLRAAGRLVASAGGRLLLIDPGDKTTAARVAWQADVPGTIESVIAADGRLFVATLEGEVHCFGPDPVAPRTLNLRRDTPSQSPGYAPAQRIVRATGVTEGYCVVLGARDARLVAALAQSTSLRVIAIAPDPGTVTTLRGALWNAGLYGARAAVLVGDTTALRLPLYFASLVVVEDGATANLVARPALLRSLFASVRPYGGAMVLSLNAAGRKSVGSLLRTGGLEGARLEPATGLSVLRRAGALAGSDNWTHQYGNPANTVSSRDSLVRAPLGLLWFGGSSNLDVLPRHGHGPPEQVVDGRLFIEGPDCLQARDVYTGRDLWKVRLPELDRKSVV